MKFFTQLKKSEVKGKTILLRVDLDIHSEDVSQSLRLERAIQSIRYTRNQKARVIILAHRGRPVFKNTISNFKFLISNKEKKELSLEPFVKILEKELKEKVVFVPDVLNGKDIISQSSYSIFLCENLRFYEGETSNDLAFAKKLAQLGDVYVNDAFANSHRAHASMSAITRFIPSYAGMELSREIGILDRILKKPKHPFVAILGGAKVSDKIGLLQWFVRFTDTILTGGGIANTFLDWCGYEVGKSIRDNLSSVQMFVKYPSIQIPRDTIIENNKIYDIGSKTIAFYAQEIRRARMIIWNGPVGLTDVKKFQKGSRALWRAIQSHARSHKDVLVLIGGGETVSFVRKESKKIPQNIFLSTGGGALLEYMSGKKLPALSALDKNKE